jgi:hypothetical protein
VCVACFVPARHFVPEVISIVAYDFVPTFDGMNGAHEDAGPLTHAVPHDARTCIHRRIGARTAVGIVHEAHFVAIVERFDDQIASAVAQLFVQRQLLLFLAEPRVGWSRHLCGTEVVGVHLLRGIGV